MEENETFSSLNLMFRMWKYCLVLPKYVYHRSENTFKYKADEKRIFISLFMFCLAVIEIYPEYVTKSGLELEILNFRVYKGFLAFYTWISILIVHWHVKDIELLLESLRIMSIRKKKLCINSWIPRKFWENFWLFYLIMMHFVHLMLNIVFFFHLYHSPMNFLSLYIFHFNSMLIVLFEQFHVTTLLNLSHYSKIMNYVLEKEDVSYRKIIEFEQFNNYIGQTAKKFCMIYSCSLLMKCAFIFDSIITALFSELNLLEVYSENLPVYICLKLFILCWFCIEISMLTILIILNVEYEKESERAVENIYDNQTRIGRTNLSYKSIELFLLKSKLNEVKCSVCGFFPLDWTLIHSMVAGTTTYLVYLIQFSEMERSRSKVQ